MTYGRLNTWPGSIAEARKESRRRSALAWIRTMRADLESLRPEEPDQ